MEAEESIEGVRAALAGLVAGLDPDAVALPEAPALWQSLDAIERLAAGAKVLVARRVEASGAWRREGCRSAAGWLAKVGGTSVGQARDQLDTSARLSALPETETAVRAGRLSGQQANAITQAATAAPGAERELLTAAGQESLGELRDRCARVRAAAEPDPEARHEAIRRSRFCRTFDSPDGAGELRYRSTRDELAEIKAVLQAFSDRAFKAARTEGRHEPGEAYAADGLLAMARSAGGDTNGAGPVPSQLIVRVDHETLVRGAVLEGETCEIAGVGPVPVSVVDRLASSPDCFLSAVVTKGVDVVSAAHLGRKFTAYQRTALLWRDPECARLGCNATVRLQFDHREDWADTHVTRVPAADRLCRHDHDLKTRQGWQLVAGTGKRPMVPPGHPDHPGGGGRPPPPDG